MIEARELTKRYGDTIPVDSLSFTIAPGTVTGFLGPNGAGKSTTMRMIMGLDWADVGHRHRQQQAPPATPCPATRGRRPAGGKRRAPRPQRPLTPAHHGRHPQIKASRVSEVIEMTGLAEVATKRVAGFSLGTGQRLDIAAALLGDPRTLILDEPVGIKRHQHVALDPRLIADVLADPREPPPARPVPLPPE